MGLLNACKLLLHCLAVAMEINCHVRACKWRVNCVPVSCRGGGCRASIRSEYRVVHSVTWCDHRCQGAIGVNQGVVADVQTRLMCSSIVYFVLTVRSFNAKVRCATRYMSRRVR